MKLGLSLAGALALAATLGGGTAAAQAPLASPRDSVKTSIGGAEVSVNYGRPSKRGRAIMDSLVPFGAVWRTGANQATHFKTTKSLVIGSTLVPAGRYTLYTVPGKAGWKLIVNKQTGQWGTEYHQEQDLARIDMKVETLPSMVEQFEIKIIPQGSGGLIRLEWEKTAASVAFVVR
jgi:hypothetical protein